MAITNIPAQFRPRPYESPFQRQMPGFMMSMLQNFISAGRRKDARRQEIIEERQFQLKKEGYTEIEPATQEPDFEKSDGGLMVGKKYYARPEDPMIRTAPIPGSTAKLLTWRQNGRTHGKILEDKETSEWGRKYTFYQDLARKKLISDKEFKKAMGMLVEEKSVPIFKRRLGGTQSLEVAPGDVEKFKGLGFERGEWKPDRAAIPPNLNTLLRQGENIIAKGMGMDVALMDKYDVDRQKQFFDKVRKYHRILEAKPELQRSAMGVRKAADLAVKMGTPTLPPTITKTSQGVKYLMDNYFMTEREAIAWLRTNIKQIHELAETAATSSPPVEAGVKIKRFSK